MKVIRVAALVLLMVLAEYASASAANTFVSPIQTFACASHTWANSLAAATAATTCTQPAVGDLSNVAAGTVLGNATGSTAAPTATSAPVLGVASTTSGTLGFFNSGSANAVTVQAPGGATAAYNFNLPIAPGTSGQVLTSQGGGATAMTWSSILAAKMTVTSKTASTYTLASAGADDWVRFDNAGNAGALVITLPLVANLSAGDNWCFTVVAAQSFTVQAAATEVFTMGNVAGAAAGSLVSSTPGSHVCVYMESTTNAQVWTSNGTWVLS
jgi:hypothetical protein